MDEREIRVASSIFFDTRIVRVTESLMFAQNLCSKFGAPPDRVRIRVTHVGLKGRKLAAASPNRLMLEKAAASENISTIEFTTVCSMEETRVEDVRRVVEPMSLLFDFTELQAGVYEEIVRNFERGVV
jgi:hypothetical protein